MELKEDVILEELSLSRGVIQSGYKEMKKWFFFGNLIQYLCLISTLYLINLTKKRSRSAIELTLSIINNYPSHKEDTVNLLRLFHDHCMFLIKIIMENYIDNYNLDHDGLPYNDDKYYMDEYKVFMLLSSAWYQLKDGISDDEEHGEKIFSEDCADELKKFNMIKHLIES
jgi:hypothetical protein